jgi:hypothetical protein
MQEVCPKPLRPWALDVSEHNRDIPDEVEVAAPTPNRSSASCSSGNASITAPHASSTSVPPAAIGGSTTTISATEESPSPIPRRTSDTAISRTSNETTSSRRYTGSLTSRILIAFGVQTAAVNSTKLFASPPRRPYETVGASRRERSFRSTTPPRGRVVPGDGGQLSQAQPHGVARPRTTPSQIRPRLAR